MHRRQVFSRILILFSLLYLQILAACGAGTPQPAPATASPTAAFTPTASPSPSPTPAPSIAGQQNVEQILYASFEEEDVNFNGKYHPVVLGYAESPDLPSELLPEEFVDVTIYQPFGNSVQLDNWLDSGGPELVKMEDEDGNEYYVPISVLESVMGEDYVESLKNLKTTRLSIYPTMPSQMFLMAYGMQEIKENSENLVGTIAGHPDTSPIKVSVLGRDLIVLGKYDPTPSNGKDDYVVLAAQPVHDTDFADAVLKADHPVSDFVIVDADDIGMGREELESLPDMTDEYQEVLATWFGKFLGGIVEEYNAKYEAGKLDGWTLANHIADPLRMAEAVEIGEDGQSFEYHHTGWVYDIRVFPENTAFSSENGSEMVHVAVNYGKDGEFIVFPLQPETVIAGQAEWNGFKYDVVKRPGGLKVIAENALEKKEQFFPGLSQIIMLDLTNPKETFNFLFDYLAYNTAEALLGIPPAEITVAYLPHNGGIPTVEWDGRELYYSASHSNLRYGGPKFNSIAYYTSLYGGVVKDTVNKDPPFSHQFAIGLDPKILEKMGVEFVDVADFTADAIKQDGVVLAEFATDNAMAGFNQTDQTTDQAFENNKKQMGAYVPRFSKYLPDGRRVGELVVEIIDRLPEGSMVVHNGPGYSPVPAFMKHYIEEEGKDIGFSGSFGVKFAEEHEDWKRWIYEYFYKNLSSGKIPEMSYLFDYDASSFTYTDKYLEGGMWTNGRWFDAYGDFGDAGREFLISGGAGTKGAYFYNFTITPTSGFLPPWLQTGFTEFGDTVYIDGRYVPFYSGFQKYNPQ